MMVGLKISECFRRINLTLKSDLKLLMFYQDGRPEDRCLLSTHQHNFEIQPKCAYAFYQDDRPENR